MTSRPKAGSKSVELRAQGRQAVRSLKRQGVVLGTTLAIFWVVFAINNVLGGMLNSLGVIPRDMIGLRGILFAPFIHERLDHLVANSIPFVALGWMVMLRDARHFVPVTLLSMISAGIFAWMLGAAGSVHIGASGVLFGYLGFLIFSGWYARSFFSIAISIVVTVVWGSVVLGVMPGQDGVSWQSHLGGFVGGALAARSYRSRR